MKPAETRKVRKILHAKGCTMSDAKGSHEKWTTPGGLSNTIVAGDRQQSPGLLRNLQSVFEPEFGPKWLDKELRR